MAPKQSCGVSMVGHPDASPRDLCVCGGGVVGLRARSGSFCHLWRGGGHLSCNGAGAWFAQAAGAERFRGGVFEFCGVGSGEGGLDSGFAAGGVQAGPATELAGTGGWLRGDDEGVLGGRVAAIQALIRSNT